MFLADQSWTRFLACLDVPWTVLADIPSPPWQPASNGLVSICHCKVLTLCCLPHDSLVPSAGCMQSSCMYTVPTALGVLIQPFGTAAALTWVWSAPPAMHQLPGMQHLATTICNSFRTAFEVVLYVVVDLGAMPGVPAAGFNAFGLSSRCETGMVYAQLLVYAHLLVAFMLPLYIAYIVEFHHKVSFWRSRGVCVIPQRSLLLPFPDNPVLSHVVVCLVSPLLLWFLAEQIAPWLNAVMS